MRQLHGLCVVINAKNGNKVHVYAVLHRNLIVFPANVFKFDYLQKSIVLKLRYCPTRFPDSP